MQNLKVPGVYAIITLHTGRTYVGQGLDVFERWSKHRRELRNGRHENRALQKAWDKYGEDGHEVRLIANFAHVPPDEVDAILRAGEIIEMAKRRNLYNRAAGGHGRSPVSDESRRKMSERRKALWADPEYRAKRAASHSKAMANPDMQARRGAAISATKSSPEYVAKQSARMKAQWQDPDFRAKRNKTLNETWADPELRKRHGEAISRSWDARRAKAK